MTARFENRSILVTGGAGGIGLGIAARLAAEGGLVLLADLAPPPEGAAPPGAAFHRTDVTLAAECEAAVAAALERWGRLDVLVNAAGVGLGGPVAALDEAVWDHVVGVNLKGAFLMSRAAWAPLAKAAGAIVNIASLAGLVVRPEMGPYAASKAGLIQLTRVLAVEGAAAGLRANAVCPVWTDTPMLTRFLEHTGHPERTLKLIRAGIPLGRVASVEDVAAAVAFLAADEARFITGVALPVDGGAGCV